MFYKKAITLVLLLHAPALKSFCISPSPDSVPAIPIIKYTVAKIFAHDTSLFTEGLAFYNGRLFESTGAPPGLAQAKCLIVSIDLVTGMTEKKVELDRTRFFGEGIAFLKGKLFQLTYKNQSGFIYDANTFIQSGIFHFRNKEDGV